MLACLGVVTTARAIRAWLSVVGLLVFWTAPATLTAETPTREPPRDSIVIGDFASAPSGSLPPEWKPLTFRGIGTHTRYAAVPDPDHGQVVMASANASASALIRRVDVDASSFPLLRWRWKVGNLIAGSDVTRRAGDDYPARIYVTFRYDPSRVSLVERARFAAVRLIYGEYPPHSGLNYIWDGKAAQGTMVPNPHTARVAMVVVESGAAHLREWRNYERNIVDDYRRAFGEDPPAISGIAIMTDTDNSGEAATAWYGNISLHALKSVVR